MPATILRLAICRCIDGHQEYADKLKGEKLKANGRDFELCPILVDEHIHDAQIRQEDCHLFLEKRSGDFIVVELWDIRGRDLPFYVNTSPEQSNPTVAMVKADIAELLPEPDDLDAWLARVETFHTYMKL